MDQELKEYLDRQFAQVDQRFAQVDQRFAQMEAQIGELRDGVHQTRVLVEKLDDKIDTVAEGVSANTEVMHRLHEESRQELGEFKTVVEESFRHLEHRVSDHDKKWRRLDQRVTALAAARA